MVREEPEAWRRRAAERAVRIAAGVEKVRQDWRTYLALVIAAPNPETLVRWTCERFGVDEEVAAAVAQLQVSQLIRRS